MGFDLHAVLLLLLAFALGGALALVLRRHAERRRTAYLAQAALMSLDTEEAEEPPPARTPSAARDAPSPADPATGAQERGQTAQTHRSAPTPPDAPAPRAEPSTRARRSPAATEGIPPLPHHVPHDMVPLAPVDPELPLGLPVSPPAPPKPKRARTRPAADRSVAPVGDAPPAAAAPVGTPPPLLDAPEGVADDLKRLKGIGPLNEQKLNTLGIYHLRQIAAWSPEEVRWVGAALTFPGRIEREAWVAQAKALVAEPPSEA